MTEPLWQNEEWIIYNTVLYHKIGRLVDFGVSKKSLKHDPIYTFREIIKVWGFDPGPLYEAFLQLATYWDLQCDYDELRKLRDEAKETAE